jgi:4-amino-4-deoxy-L-arabinose transferase-like glycosyltransferase
MKSNIRLQAGIISLLIIILGFVFRLYNLGGGFPVFADEAIYIRWAQVMRAEETLRFLPLSDGKQPLFMWVVIPFLKVIKDPLVAGRLVSVLSGVGIILGVGLVSWLLFNSRKIALISMLLVAICPYLVLFDRKALVDSFLGWWGIATLLLGILLSRYPRLDLALLTGFALGGAWLTKSPGELFFFLLPTAILLSNRSNLTNRTYLTKVFGSIFIAWTVGIALYNILRLGPNFHLIASRNLDYIYPVADILRHPLMPLVPNLKSVAMWFTLLLPLPIVLLSLVGLTFLLLRRHAIGIFLIIWGIGPIILQTAIGRVFTARYILFTIPVILILAAFGLAKVPQKNPIIRLLTVFLIAIPVLWQNVLLVTQPEKALLPVGERSGYLEEWTAGIGLREIALYLKNKPADVPILVGTEGFFGTTPDGLQIFVEGRKNIRVTGLSFPVKEVPKELQSAIYDNEVYLVVNQSRFAIQSSAELGLVLIDSYARPKRPDGTSDALLFFRYLGDGTRPLAVR